jgi:hypothetical protein
VPQNAHAPEIVLSPCCGSGVIRRRKAPSLLTCPQRVIEVLQAQAKSG